MCFRFAERRGRPAERRRTLISVRDHPRMTRPRAAPRSTPKTPPPAEPARARFGLPRAGLYRLGARSIVACAVVGCLTLVAGWHSAGLVRRGEIDRMLRMGAGMTPQARAEQQARGKLDRGRLKALAETAGRP